MTIAELKKYLKDNNLLGEVNLSFLAKGNNYLVYLAVSAKDKYVIKVRRTDVAGNDRLGREYHVLEFLQSRNVDFVQKPVFFDAKKSISILTFIPGRLRGVSGLDKNERRLFVKQVFSIHAIKYAQYLSFCKKNKTEAMPIVDSKDKIREFGTKRLKTLKESGCGNDLCAWIEPRLKMTESEFGEKGPLIFSHQDLAGSNIITNKKGIFFIDWDMAAFTRAHDYLLAYMRIHDDGFTPRKFASLVKEYSEQARVGEQELWRRIESKTKIVKLFDVIWAAEQYATMKKAGKKGWSGYLEMARTRIKEYEIMK